MGRVQARLRAEARTLHADVVARGVGADFAERGIPFLLLRGPALAGLRRSRTYVDVDLLVPPSRLEEAELALRGLGFAPTTTPRDFRLRGNPHAHEWRRHDGGAVDLHHTVSGAGADDETVWRVLAAGAETVDVSGTELPSPGQAATALLAVLHAAHHGPRIGQPLLDLEAAIERLRPEEWAETVRLAKALDAEAAFAAGLRLDERGAELAHRLGLPEAAPGDVRLRASDVRPVALSLLALLDTPGLAGKARLILHGLAPTPAGLRHARRLARRGRWGLALAYASQPLWTLRWALGSVRAVRRARRGAA
jgi:putative nucleotidyltransferase-like protein